MHRRCPTSKYPQRNRKEDGEEQLSIRGGGGQELPELQTIQELPLDLTCMGAKSYPWLPTMQELPLHRLHRLQMGAKSYPWLPTMQELPLHCLHYHQ
jgi:hypothetical protein